MKSLARLGVCVVVSVGMIQAESLSTDCPQSSHREPSPAHCAGPGGRRSFGHASGGADAQAAGGLGRGALVFAFRLQSFPEWVVGLNS